MNIEDSIALVTGANRGLGLEFTRRLLDRGAKAVYATARRPETLEPLREEYGERVRPLRIDVLDEDSILAASAAAADITLLINNAGIATENDIVSGDLTALRAEMDTHFWGTVRMIRAFSPVLAANGGGAIVNVMSALSFLAHSGSGGYAAAKAAQWQATNSVRLELAAQGTHVLGVHLAATDTDMMAAYDIPKNSPADAVSRALAALEDGRFEVFDEQTAQIKAALSLPAEQIYADSL
ncbi:MAG: SDR family oxidoreductase [Microbacterium sp.]